MPLFNTVPGSVAPKATYNTSTIVENPIYSYTSDAGGIDNIATCFVGGSSSVGQNPPFLVSSGRSIVGINIQNNQLNLNIDFPHMSSGQIACDYVNSVYYYILGNNIIVFSHSNGYSYISGTDHLPEGTLYWITVNPNDSTVTLQTSTGIHQYTGEITTTISSTDWNLINPTVISTNPSWVRDGIFSADSAYGYLLSGDTTILVSLDKLNDSGITWTKAVYDFGSVSYYFLSRSHIYKWNLSGNEWTKINYPGAGISNFYDLCYDHSLNSLFVITNRGIWIFDTTKGIWSKVNSDLSGNFICSDGEGNFLIGDTLTTLGSTKFTYFTYPLSTTTTTKTLVPALEKIKTTTLPEGHMYGDYDRDCIITDYDSNAIRDIILGNLEDTDTTWADLNLNGSINIDDAQTAYDCAAKASADSENYYFGSDCLRNWQVNSVATNFKYENIPVDTLWTLSKSSKYLWYCDIEMSGVTESSVITIDGAITVDFSNKVYDLTDLNNALRISKGLTVDLSAENIALLDVVQDGEINDKDIDLLHQYNYGTTTLDPTTMLTKAIVHSDYTIGWFDIIPMENKIRIIVKKLPSHPIPLKITSSDVSGNSYKYKGSTLYISSNTNILDYSATVDDILGGE